jgi:flagellar basal body-associated protein FliL
MPEDAPTAAQEHDEAPAPPAKAALLARLKIPLFVAAVVGAEVLVAYFCIPGESQTAAIAAAALGGNPQSNPLATPPPPPDEEAQAVDQVEVDLGEFDVTAFQPVSNSTLRVSVHVWGTVADKDQAAFQDLTQGNQQRLREQVLVTIRSADSAELTEPGLGVVKRKILDRMNKTLGKPLLRTIVFSDFSSIEE